MISSQRGVGLLDSIVGVALMTIIFVGVSGVFKLSIELVSNNKARVGALALAQGHMEYIQSLDYDAVGTLGGIPSGTLSQISQETLNGVVYTRRTLIRYIDDPKDGSGAADQNSIVTDAKEIKVELSWVTRGQLRSSSLITRRSPDGIEQAVPGGTLSIEVVDASSTPVQGALVDIVNASTSVDTQAYSNDDGVVTFLGAPAGTGYRINVSKTGFSSAQTYTASSTNSSPDPGHLTVALNQTTTATFSIGPLGTHTFMTYEAIQQRVWTDTFDDVSKLYATASSTVSGGALLLDGGAGSYEPEGSARAVPVSVAYLSAWKEVEFSDTRPVGTAIRYYIYADDVGTLVPDTDLPGNSAGFTTSPIDLSGLSTTTYSTVRVGAVMTTLDLNETPRITEWEVLYDQGPIPLGNVPFTMIGAKTIGTHSGAPVYKYTANHQSDVGGGLDIPNLEFDTHRLSVDGATFGHDVAESCPPLPRSLFAGGSILTRLYFLPHTTHSLRVDVRTADGVTLADASVRLYRTGVNTTQATGGCGQTFFPDLAWGTISGGNAYSIDIAATGYTPQTITNVEVSGASAVSVIMAP
ncbi:MAG: carboxypeptidase regulatory-like domain-containing protein [Candidatus Pacebacteria bacterium]|nr:carboxypeptidase regulatory-like domain-containing protein [Candidatus Paceibacterota bacterium]